MAISIAQAQKGLLNTDFLDTLGSGKGEFSATRGTLQALAGELAEIAVNNLIKSNKVASGFLTQSIKPQDPQQFGKSIRVDVMMAEYGLYIDKGVKGTKGGSGEYSFKNNKVGYDMARSIRKWLIKEKRAVSTVKKYKGINKREKFRKTITQTSDSIAFAIGVSIKQKGIKATGFMTKAIRDIRKKAKDEFGKAFKVDIISTLPKKL